MYTSTSAQNILPFQTVWLETGQTSTPACKTASLREQLLIEQIFPSGGWGATKSDDKMLLSALKQTSLNKKCCQFRSQFVPEAENMYLPLHMMRAALCAYLVKLSKRRLSKTPATLLLLFMEMWKSIQFQYHICPVSTEAVPRPVLGLHLAWNQFFFLFKQTKNQRSARKSGSRVAQRRCWARKNKSEG